MFKLKEKKQQASPCPIGFCKCELAAIIQHDCKGAYFACPSLYNRCDFKQYVDYKNQIQEQLNELNEILGINNNNVNSELQVKQQSNQLEQMNMNVNMDLEFEFYDDYSNSTVDEMFEEEFSSESISY